MNCYGKNFNELTENERKLLNVDSLLCTSMLMYLSGESLIGSNPNNGITSGTKEDIKEKMFIRTNIICEILDLKDEDITDNIFGDLESTQYGLQKVGYEFSIATGEPKDIFYHYSQMIIKEEEREMV